MVSRGCIFGNCCWGLSFRESWAFGGGCVLGNPHIDAFWGWISGICILGVSFRGIPTLMPSGGCNLCICIQGVAFWGIPTPMPSGVAFWLFAFWRLCFEESRHRCLLGVAFWVFAIWRWRFAESPHRCLLGVVFCVFAFWGFCFGDPHTVPSGGWILGICVLGFLFWGIRTPINFGGYIWGFSLWTSNGKKGSVKWRCEHAQSRGFLGNFVNLHNATS